MKIVLTNDFIDQLLGLTDKKLRNKIYDDYLSRKPNSVNVKNKFKVNDHPVEGYGEYNLFTSWVANKSTRYGAPRILYFAKNQKIYLWRILENHEYEKLTKNIVRDAFKCIGEQGLDFSNSDINSYEEYQNRPHDEDCSEFGRLVYTARQSIGIRKGEELFKFVDKRLKYKNKEIVLVSPFIGKILDSEKHWRDQIDKQFMEGARITIITSPPKTLTETERRNAVIKFVKRTIKNRNAQNFIKKLRRRYQTINPQDLVKCSCTTNKRRVTYKINEKIMRLCPDCRKLKSHKLHQKLVSDQLIRDNFYKCVEEHMRYNPNVKLYDSHGCHRV